MDRQIKFRTRIYKGSRKDYSDVYLGLDEIQRIDSYDYTIEFRGQGTGLKDSKGVEVYEGDIVRENDLPDKYICAVKFGWYCGLDFYDRPGVGFYLQRLDCEVQDGLDDLLNYTVIGNVYENPELLTVKE